MARDPKDPDRGSEKYQVSDPSVLFEDVWADGGEDGGAGKQACPTCGYGADPGEIRCPRCFTLLVTGCSGSCGSCGQRRCTGQSRRR
jgi:hypothetical protein